MGADTEILADIHQANADRIEQRLPLLALDRHHIALPDKLERAFEMRCKARILIGGVMVETCVG
ncbi:hypothetical protein [Ensifer canadensis]